MTISVSIFVSVCLCLYLSLSVSVSVSVSLSLSLSASLWAAEESRPTYETNEEPTDGPGVKYSRGGRILV